MTGFTTRFKPGKTTITAWILAITVLLCAGWSGATETEQEIDDQSAFLKQSIEESLRLEKDLLAGLEQEREKLRELEPGLLVELEDYRTLHTTHTNMLAQPMPDPGALEQADAHIKAALIRIQGRLDAFNKQFNAIRPLRTGLNEQLAINNAYLKEIRKSRKKAPQDAEFIQNLETLVDTIKKKQQLLDKLADFYQSYIDKLNDFQSTLQALSPKLTARLSESRTSSLLIRRVTLFAAGSRDTLVKEADSLFQQLKHLVSAAFIGEEFGLMWKSASSFLAVPMLLFLLTLMIAFRMRSVHLKIWEKSELQNCPAFRLAWRALNRSIFLLVITVFLFAYTHSGKTYVPAHMVILLSLCQLFLYIKWGMDILSGAGQSGLINIQPAFLKRLRVLSSLILFYMAAYIFISHGAQPGNILLTWARLGFEILFIAWCLEFWKTDRRLQPPAMFARKGFIKKEAVRILTYSISFGGLAFEIAGYGGISLFWYASWGQTLVIGMWAGLCYNALQELSGIFQADPDKIKDGYQSSGAPVTWLFLKLGQPVVLVIFLMAVILSWGGKRTFLITLIATIRKTYHIGSIEFSILGFIYALAALLITHIIAQSWRHFFQQKLLARSGMVIGLQESLTTISVYLLWVLGVLVSLSFLGLNTTSLAVAFGALGIGVGFGLQNIVNNFISGIILLLERPIQVGDDIQVNDMWATVKKINIRSTIVQTYDNASVIIPNSDLISNQVINWSFNDNRLRRSIVVGVAYGSDIELVRQTLLEAAASVPRVFRQPRPDVIFRDFGDSALIFHLRIWTHVTYYLSVETDVRFAIDRLFRERDISIPFPQRDIHIINQNPPAVTE
ncbi:MAG: mechanosensitive ion channel domain-containing protein [Thermodesulfobacteriota bacterium]